MFGVKAFTKKLSRDVQKMLSFPCGCRTNLFVLLTQLFFFYSAVIGGFFRKSFSAVHQELAWEQEFVPIPCNQCWLVMPAACERKSAFSGHGNSSDSMRAGGGGDSRHSAQSLSCQLKVSSSIWKIIAENFLQRAKNNNSLENHPCSLLF